MRQLIFLLRVQCRVLYKSLKSKEWKDYGLYTVGFGRLPDELEWPAPKSIRWA